MRINFSLEEKDGGKVLVVNGELFDWALDESAIEEANQFSSNRDVMRAVHSDVKEFFLNCLEEQTGLRMSLGEVNEAIRKGYVEA